MTVATKLEWDHSTPWASAPELGSIYTQPVKFNYDDNYEYEVEFFVADGYKTGLLFAIVKSFYADGYPCEMSYCLGHFSTNEGAKKFAQFAFEHFVETTTWSVCPSFEPVDWIGGDAYYLNGEEVVAPEW